MSESEEKWQKMARRISKSEENDKLWQEKWAKVKKITRN